MARYKIVTLVDITRSQPPRDDRDPIRTGQQANFNSLLQGIGMRSNVSWNRDPKKYTGSLPDDIKGKATHWVWEFDAEREDVFLKDDDPCGLLKEDLHGVPVVDLLENSVDLNPAAFQTRNGNQNTWITII
jgi:hypothetical protein